MDQDKRRRFRRCRRRMGFVEEAGNLEPVVGLETDEGRDDEIVSANRRAQRAGESLGRGADSGSYRSLGTLPSLE